jgi:hypothetical protein
MNQSIYLINSLDTSAEGDHIKDHYAIYALNPNDHCVGLNTATIRVHKIATQQLIFKRGDITNIIWGPSQELNMFKPSFFSDVNVLRPTFLVDIDDKSIRTYSAILFYDSSIVFQLSGTTNFSNKLSWSDAFNVALKNHLKNRVALTNQDAWFKKYHPDSEIEYKLNLNGSLNIWSLANYFYNVIAQNQLPGFIPQILDPFNQWDFKNYLYEIVAPRSMKGYVSFIECPNEKFVVKQKIFEKDALERVELRTKNVEIKTTMENYLVENFPGIRYVRHEPFSRRRYDVNLESIHTGNIYSIMFDHSWLINDKSKTLSQCEIEYLKSRSVLPLRRVKVDQKLILDFVVQKLANLHIEPKQTYYSKLSFLKDSLTHK